ncbi:MAG TPA: Gfo/Idh/MocA family oxidoreductase, partial [Chloroflexi bacterium]|nr:Gfo/Idh/MocA family oxidoreductase [Chloroflexota bacterium]
MPDVRVLALGSRSRERGEQFAAAHGVERVYDSYEALADDPDVDAIYVCTPHSFHAKHARLCLERGKPVLCEKPMAVNARQVQEMIDTARRQGVFLMEAMWVRFTPVTRTVLGWLKEGCIGEPRLLSGHYGFRTEVNPRSRLFDPALAGGSLLDMGVYGVSTAAMVFGPSPVEISAEAHVGKTGVDEQVAMLLRYPNGELAMLSSAIRTRLNQPVWIHGTHGAISMEQMGGMQSATLRVDGEDPITVEDEAHFGFEIAEAISCIREERIESEIWPPECTLATHRIMDEVRRQIGVRYPVE